MKLSEHFSLEELCVSSTADRMGIANTPGAKHMANMLGYLAPGLELVRVICGSRPMVLTNAYRNPAVNHAVGGTPTSAHPMGFAADCHFAGLSDLVAAQMIAAAMKAHRIKIDQLILEDRRCVHVSFDPRSRMMAGHQPGAAGTPINWGFFG